MPGGILAACFGFPGRGKKARDKMNNRHCGFETGGWRVAPARCVLTRGEEQVRLEPKVMDVLVCLAGRAGEVVTKEELIREVWEGRFVGDEVITVAISELRKALGDNARQPTWVETIPRRGYRWIPPVGTETAGAGAAAVVSGPEKSSRWLLTAAAAAIALAVFSFLVLRPDFRGSAAGAVKRSAEAEAAYRKGLRFLDQYTMPGTREALAKFEEAVQREPDFAEAHAGIAQACVVLGDTGGGKAMYARARTAAERALALAPDLAEAHASLAQMQLLNDWDAAAAERSYRRAIALQPKLVSAHRGYASLLSAQGRLDEAIAEAQRAVEADPAAARGYIDLAWTLNYAGRYREALAELERALELDRGMFGAYMAKAITLELTGDPRAAYEAMRSGYYRVDRGPEAVKLLDAAYEKEGMRGVYRTWLTATLQGAPNMPKSGVWQARLMAQVGEKENALTALERAYQEREGGLLWIGVEPGFLALRGEPRFQRLVQMVGQRN